jgi:hypothetical protein
MACERLLVPAFPGPSWNSDRLGSPFQLLLGRRDSGETSEPLAGCPHLAHRQLLGKISDRRRRRMVYHAARVGDELAGKDSQERGFARAVGPHNSHARPCRNGQRDILENLYRAQRERDGDRCNCRTAVHHQDASVPAPGPAGYRGQSAHRHLDTDGCLREQYRQPDYRAAGVGRAPARVVARSIGGGTRQHTRGLPEFGGERHEFGHTGFRVSDLGVHESP